jgi:hypothetical protein
MFVAVAVPASLPAPERHATTPTAEFHRKLEQFSVVRRRSLVRVRRKRRASI